MIYAMYHVVTGTPLRDGWADVIGGVGDALFVAGLMYKFGVIA